MNYNNVMIDIETLGVDPTSCILSIAAVYFDPATGSTGNTFHEYIDLQSCLDLGMTINASTFIFWMNQNDEARSQFNQCKKENIKLVLTQLYDFLKDDQNIIWANSPSFDCAILKSAYKKSFNCEPRWKYYNERDLRTLTNLFPLEEIELDISGIQKGNHNALNDCYYQIQLLSAIYNRNILK